MRQEGSAEDLLGARGIVDDRILGLNPDEYGDPAAWARWPYWLYSAEQAAKYAVASQAFMLLSREFAMSRRGAAMCSTVSSHCRAVAAAIEEDPTGSFRTEHPHDLGLLAELLRQAEIKIRNAVVADPSETHPGPWWSYAEQVYLRLVHVAERITTDSGQPIRPTAVDAQAISEVRLAAECRSLSEAAALVRKAAGAVEHPSPRTNELRRLADEVERHAEDLDPEGLVRSVLIATGIGVEEAR
ncbi:hypothetical protein [Mycobacteroides salmoniphilum]|uniref:Uncharacterized protein n=1 Tax=Mycobacteroides salmoniphilum TaxID=404941 RepID=A0A4R8T068_9MYCO|nr:hypothetical protein [Mycobacteroides salmoniphilum]TEA09146.1 hypothetical protein CCUG60884_00315 [Mycobacteroides salmoniphilum]